MVILGFGCAAPAAPLRADAPAEAAQEAGRAPLEAGSDLPNTASGDASQALAYRIERLLPVLMSSLAAARRERERELVRCFDRAVSELHGLRRQVAYHAERHLRAPEPSERDRHQRALSFLAQRVEELAHSGETCFTDGVLLPPGKTRVDVVFAPPRR
jgi:hypothetical protein